MQKLIKFISRESLGLNNTREGLGGTKVAAKEGPTKVAYLAGKVW